MEFRQWPLGFWSFFYKTTIIRQVRKWNLLKIEKIQSKTIVVLYDFLRVVLSVWVCVCGGGYSYVLICVCMRLGQFANAARCISGRGISVYNLDRGRVELSAYFAMLAGRRVDVKLLYKSVHRKLNQLEIRCGRENQHPAEGTPIEQLQLEGRCWNEEHVPERLGPQALGWAA